MLLSMKRESICKVGLNAAHKNTAVADKQTILGKQKHIIAGDVYGSGMVSVKSFLTSTGHKIA